MSIYSEALEMVQNGCPFYINLKKRNLTVARKRFIKDGVYDGDLGVDTSNWTHELNKLYREYKYSLPNEERKKGYFKALSIDEIADGDLFVDINRNEAKFRLEAFVLCMALNGIRLDGWFWIGEDDDCVVLNEWLKGEN